MGETKIEWTATVNPDGSVTPGASWNPVTGCSKVSAGCKNCYAELVFPRVYARQCNCGHDIDFHQYLGEENGDENAVNCRLCGCDTFAARKFTDVLTHPNRLQQPLHWKKPRRIFVNSMSDLFHEDVPFEFIDKVFAVMALSPQHTYQILTKRPERMREYCQMERWALVAEARGETEKPFQWPLPNVWLGVSCENQQTADERIPILLQTPAAVRFVSYEPALAAIDLSSFRPCVHAIHHGECAQHSRLHWVIIGGESGPKARPFNIQWSRAVIQQCKAAGVPVFMKQLGAQPFLQYSNDLDVQAVPLKLEDRKGGNPEEWPDDLRVREFPSSARVGEFEHRRPAGA